MKHTPQTALVTGASSGIGLEICRILCAMRRNLVLVSRNHEVLERVRGELLQTATTVSITVIPADLSHENAARNLYEECRRQNLQIDILVNNAGFGLLGEHVGFDPEQVTELTILNVTSLTTLCSLFGKDMKERKSGYILNVASTAAYQPIPFFAAYAASKSYVFSFSQALARELEDYGVSVTCLNPGPTSTNFFAVAGAEEMKGFSGLKTNMSAVDVAQAGITGMFARKRVVIPGFRNRIAAFWGSALPRSLLLWILKQIMRRGTGKQPSRE